MSLKPYFCPIWINLVSKYFANLTFLENNIKQLFWINFKGSQTLTVPQKPNSGFWETVRVCDPLKLIQKSCLILFSKNIRFAEYFNTKFIQIGQEIRFQ